MSLKTNIEKITAAYHREIASAIKNADPSEVLEALQITAPSVLGASKPARAAKADAPAKTKAPRKAAAKGDGGKRIRRSQEALDALLNDVVAAVKSSGDAGLSISGIASKIGAHKRDVGRPLTLALKDGFLKKVGERRDAKYVAA